MVTVIAFLGALAALLGALPAALRAVAPFVKLIRRDKPPGRQPKPKLKPHPWDDWFSDERGRMSRRTSAAQGCAVLTCGFSLVLVSISGSGVRPHSATAAVLLAAVGLTALIGVASGVDKVRASGGNKRQLVLVASALGGTAVCLAAWVFSLVLTASLWT